MADEARGRPMWQGADGAPPALVQYLNGVLSQNPSSPSALPYADDVKWTARDHLLGLLNRYPSLALNDRDFTHNDGRTVHLLVTDGTIPIHYQSVKYNIPIIMWLVESYPRSPPICYVNPTPDMVVKPKHPFVNGSGHIWVPYLAEWNASSTLSMLVDVISSVFSHEPPLFARPQNPEHAPPHSASAYPPAPSSTGAAPHATYPSHAYPPPAATSAYPSHPLHSAPASASLSAYQAPSANPPLHAANLIYPTQMSNLSTHALSSMPYPTQPTSYTTNTTSPATSTPPAPVGSKRPEEAFRERATVAVASRLTEKLALLESAAMERHDATRGQLESRHALLATHHEALGVERDALGQRVNSLSAANAALATWLKENEQRPVMQDEAVDVDAAFVAADALGAQALAAAAEDAALEDALYALDQALEAGALPADAYLKQVRVLARQQFCKRALGLKIATKRLPRDGHSVANRGRAAHSAPSIGTYALQQQPADVEQLPPLPGNGAWLDLSMPASQLPRV